MFNKDDRIYGNKVLTKYFKEKLLSHGIDPVRVSGITITVDKVYKGEGSLDSGADIMVDIVDENKKKLRNIISIYLQEGGRLTIFELDELIKVNVT